MCEAIKQMIAEGEQKGIAKERERTVKNAYELFCSLYPDSDRAAAVSFIEKRFGVPGDTVQKILAGR